MRKWSLSKDSNSLGTGQPGPSFSTFNFFSGVLLKILSTPQETIAGLWDAFISQKRGREWRLGWHRVLNWAMSDPNHLTVSLFWSIGRPGKLPGRGTSSSLMHFGDSSPQWSMWPEWAIWRNTPVKKGHLSNGSNPSGSGRPDPTTRQKEHGN